MRSPATAVGDRVRLIRTTDQYTRLEPGSLGTVRFIDSLGTVHVEWDSGSSLGLASAGGDEWEVVDFPLVEETQSPSELPTVSEWLNAGAPMREVDGDAS